MEKHVVRVKFSYGNKVMENVNDNELETESYMNRIYEMYIVYKWTT